MKSLILLALLTSTSAFAQADASIFNNVGRSGPMQAYQMRTLPNQMQQAPAINPMQIRTVTNGNNSYTTGTDSSGHIINCRTMRAGSLTNTFCD